MRAVAGVSEVIAPSNSGVQYLQVALNRAALGQSGLSGDGLQAQLRALVEGERIGIVPEGVARTPLILRGGAALRQSPEGLAGQAFGRLDRKSTRLNSSHSQISYAVFCLKKKKNTAVDRT